MAGTIAKITGHVVEGMKQSADDFKAAYSSVKGQKVALVALPHPDPLKLNIVHNGNKVEASLLARRGNRSYYTPASFMLKKELGPAQKNNHDFGVSLYQPVKSVQLEERPSGTLYQVHDGQISISSRTRADFPIESEELAHAELASLSGQSFAILDKSEALHNLHSKVLVNEKSSSRLSTLPAARKQSVSFGDPDSDTASTRSSSTAGGDNSSVHSSFTTRSKNSHTSAASSVVERFGSGELMKF